MLKHRKQYVLALIVVAFFYLGIPYQGLVAAPQRPNWGITDSDKQNADKSETVKRAPDRKWLEAQIGLARNWIETAHTGHIVVGQLVMEGTNNPADAMGQMQIHRGGFFATAVKTYDRPLTFRQHGYQPLDVPLKGRSGDFVDLGRVQMKRMAPHDGRALRGKLALESSTDYAKAEVRFVVNHGEVNSPNGGTAGHSPVEPVRARVDAAGNVTGSGFSPIGYYYTATAPGYVQEQKAVSFEPAGGADLGTIKLERPRRVALSYISSQTWQFPLGSQVHTNFTTDDKWAYDKQYPGCSLTLRQKDGEPFFWSGCGPDRLADLGTGSLQRYATTITGNEKGAAALRTKLAAGHVYSFGVTGDWLTNATRLLFKVETISP